MAKKNNILDDLPEYRLDQVCDECQKPPAAKLGNQQLCIQCAIDDVFNSKAVTVTCDDFSRID